MYTYSFIENNCLLLVNRLFDAQFLQSNTYTTDTEPTMSISRANLDFGSKKITEKKIALIRECLLRTQHAVTSQIGPRNVICAQSIINCWPASFLLSLPQQPALLQYSQSINLTTAESLASIFIVTQSCTICI